MRKFLLRSIGITIVLSSFLSSALANPITHCYHWLDENMTGKKFLAAKYDYAKKNNGAILNITGTGGTAGGIGLYCSGNLSSSAGYGDRVIRIEFNPDVVISAGGVNYCPAVVDRNKCASSPADADMFQPANSWYVIKNLNSILSWSANSDELVQDLQRAITQYPGQAAHFQATINFINQEQKTLGKQTFLNSLSRFAIKDLIDKPEFIDKTNPVEIIKMISISPKAILSDSEKARYTNKFVLLAMNSNKHSVSYEALTAAVGTDVAVKSGVVNTVKTALTTSQVNQLSLNFAATALADSSLGISKDRSKLILKGLIADPKKLDDSLAVAKNNTEVKALLLENLPDLNIFYANLAGHAAESWVQFFDENMTRSNQSKLSPYFAKSIEKAMAGGSSEKIFATLDKVKNPLADTSKIIQQLIATNSLFDENSDYTEAVKIMIRLSDKMSKAQIANLAAKLNNLKMNSQVPAFVAMQEITDEKLVLPDYISVQNYIERLIEKSLTERSEGKIPTPTNTYRFLFDNVAGYYRKQGAKDPAKFKEGADHFMKISLWFASSPYPGYAYIALQNSSYFMGATKYTLHPIETWVNHFMIKNKEPIPPAIQAVFENSADLSLVKYLMAAFDQTKDNDYKKPLKAIVEAMMKNFGDYSSGPNTKQTELDKKHYGNRILDKNERADYCSFLTFMGTQAEKLAELRVGFKDQIETKTKELFEKSCK